MTDRAAVPQPVEGIDYTVGSGSVWRDLGLDDPEVHDPFIAFGNQVYVSRDKRYTVVARRLTDHREYDRNPSFNMAPKNGEPGDWIVLLTSVDGNTDISSASVDYWSTMMNSSDFRKYFEASE